VGFAVVAVLAGITSVKVTRTVEDYSLLQQYFANDNEQIENMNEAYRLIKARDLRNEDVNYGLQSQTKKH